jgi:hypothetical protein
MQGLNRRLALSAQRPEGSEKHRDLCFDVPAVPHWRVNDLLAAGEQ